MLDQCGLLHHYHASISVPLQSAPSLFITESLSWFTAQKRKDNSSVVEMFDLNVDGDHSRRSSSSRLTEVLPSSIPTSREELPWHEGMSSKCSCIPSLSFKYRVIGFFITAGIGLAMSYLVGVLKPTLASLPYLPSRSLFLVLCSTPISGPHSLVAAPPCVLLRIPLPLFLLSRSLQHAHSHAHCCWHTHTHTRARGYSLTGCVGGRLRGEDNCVCEPLHRGQCIVFVQVGVVLPSLSVWLFLFACHAFTLTLILRLLHLLIYTHTYTLTHTTYTLSLSRARALSLSLSLSLMRTSSIC
jgi:hypothetical protein